MRRFFLIGFLALMSFDTLTQISTKYTSLDIGEPVPALSWVLSVFSSPWFYAALGGYLGSFICWMTLLRYAPVGPSFAASHLELVSVTVLSVLLFNEPLNACKIVGGALILLGVLCLARSEGQAPGRADK